VYYIVKIQRDQLYVWVPKKQGFYQEVVMPYHSLELVNRVYKRLLLKYSKNYIGIVDSENLSKLKQEMPQWKKKPDNYNVIRGENYSQKGEIRGANYNDKGHTNVGEVGWMKYRTAVYGTKWVQKNFLSDSPWGGTEGLTGWAIRCIVPESLTHN